MTESVKFGSNREVLVELVPVVLFDDMLGPDSSGTKSSGSLTFIAKDDISGWMGRWYLFEGGLKKKSLMEASTRTRVSDWEQIVSSHVGDQNELDRDNLSQWQYTRIIVEVQLEWKNAVVHA